MLVTRYQLTLGLICAGLLLAGAPAAAQFDDGTSKLWKKHLPWRVHKALGEKAIGVLLYDGQPVLSLEGRSGPTDQLCFSQDGNSYRWVYVPTEDANPMITNLTVPIGKDKNGGNMIFPKLHMASPKSVAGMGVMTQFTLVEVEVNNGLGSPENDSFTATKFKVLEGTNEYPLKVGQVLTQLKEDYAKYVKDQEPKINDEMRKAQQAALKEGQKPDGARNKKDIVYITWITQDNVLEVRFLSKISDGHYNLINVGGPNPGPFPLPVPPIKDPKVPPLPLKPGDLPPPPKADNPPPAPAPVPAKAAPAQAAPAQVAPALPPPPPPPFKQQFKVGTTFGVEFGRIYRVSKDGKTIQTGNLSFESFTQVLNPPPFVGGGGPFNPPPLPPVKKEK